MKYPQDYLTDNHKRILRARKKKVDWLGTSRLEERHCSEFLGLLLIDQGVGQGWRHLKVQLKVDLLLSSLWWLMYDSILHGLLDWGSRFFAGCGQQPVLSIEQLKAIGFTRASKQEGKRENKLAQWKSVFYDLLLEVTPISFAVFSAQ